MADQPVSDAAPEVLRPYTGPHVFGPAYGRMYENDSHAPGSVDRVLLERMIRICAATIPFLYPARAPSLPAYRRGSRPVLEAAAAEATGDTATDEEKTSAIARFTASLAQKVAAVGLDDMLFGGTEEQILARGSDWCTDVARLGCVLYQVLGFPCRIVFLANLKQAYSGHAIVEVHWGSGWGAVDTSTGVVYRSDLRGPVSVRELMEHPVLVERHQSPQAAYTTAAQFSAAAIANYGVWEAGRYDFSISKVNSYCRSILAQAMSGWPGGLRWLHGEEAEAPTAGTP